MGGGHPFTTVYADSFVKNCSLQSLDVHIPPFLSGVVTKGEQLSCNFGSRSNFSHICDGSHYRYEMGGATMGNGPTPS